MIKSWRTPASLLLLACSLWLTSGQTAQAGPSTNHSGRHQHDRPHEHRRLDDHPRWRHDRNERYFTEQHRQIVRDYYYNSYWHNDCPPGLAKKRNGCQPPGHTRHWRIGRILPPGIVVYEVPPYVTQRIGHPPTGYRFVRVASDILMIAIGSGLVIDAIADLNTLR